MIGFALASKPLYDFNKLLIVLERERRPFRSIRARRGHQDKAQAGSLDPLAHRLPYLLVKLASRQQLNVTDFKIAKENQLLAVLPANVKYFDIP